MVLVLGGKMRIGMHSLDGNISLQLLVLSRGPLALCPQVSMLDETAPE